MSTSGTTDDSRLARQLAEEAGGVLLQLRADRPGLGVAELKDEGDAAAQEILARRLMELRPNDSVLSEEAVDNPARLTADRVWIIDPLDGTREYGEGRDDWAVHVALWTREAGGLATGAIALPGRDLVLGADDAPAVVAEHDGTIRVAVSRTRPPALLASMAEKLPLEFVPMGSAGVKIAAVLLDEVDAYVHAGGQYEWDSAAPVAVAQAAGAHTSRIDGSPLIYNRESPSLPDLLVCRPGLAPVLLEAIAAAGQ